MKALITGISGFVGSHLAEYLLATGRYDVSGTIRWRSRRDAIAPLCPRIQLHDCDIRDPSSIRSVIAAVRPDVIFHLAAQSYVPFSWRAPAETLSTNIIGELNLFESVRDLRLECRIQIAGSSEEYGLVLPNEIPITEDNPLRPLSPYGVSKVAQDLLAYQYFKSYGLKVIRTRAFNHTGPRRGDVFVTSNFARQIAAIEAKRQPPVIRVGNLDAVRDFTDVRDVVRAYAMVAEQGTPGEVYNIASGKGVRIREMLDMLIGLGKAKITVQTEPERMRPSDVELLIGSAEKIHRATGWRPEIPFTQTMKDLLEFWRAAMK